MQAGKLPVGVVEVLGGFGTGDKVVMSVQKGFIRMENRIVVVAGESLLTGHEVEGRAGAGAVVQALGIPGQPLAQGLPKLAQKAAVARIVRAVFMRKVVLVLRYRCGVVRRRHADELTNRTEVVAR